MPVLLVAVVVDVVVEMVTQSGGSRTPTPVRADG
jgi:hypothetical protein